MDTPSFGRCAVLRALVELCDNGAGGSFTTTRYDRVDRRRRRGDQQPGGEPRREPHVLEIGFINRVWMLEKNARNHDFALFCCRISGNIDRHMDKMLP